MLTLVSIVGVFRRCNGRLPNQKGEQIEALEYKFHLELIFMLKDRTKTVQKAFDLPLPTVDPPAPQRPRNTHTLVDPNEIPQLSWTDSLIFKNKTDVDDLGHLVSHRLLSPVIDLTCSVG